ncbi:hypothetical protein K432DRAFT_408330 [Lepidopterella palustris CBS 459.81]|uniref:Uncharacterized protein n=1 Tax=Lepidopterella palustris CBS 459.81 TaxID=1314670 RepID=A0A8E2E2T7_9PEZI|nr:hypothetical protein K432DRAFT_408330 [Lepidopterella palustris CBS 459.81]
MNTSIPALGEDQNQSSGTQLPALTITPTHYPCCCLSLSTLLINQTTLLLPTAPQTVLSIGSGTGLFEAYLLAHSPTLDLAGIEVCSSPPINKYLPEQHTSTVAGTWDITPLSRTATTWIFVYPRSPHLVTAYLQQPHAQENLTTILWFGPKADWSEFEPCFNASALHRIEVLADAALSPYEVMVIAKKPKPAY